MATVKTLFLALLLVLNGTIVIAPEPSMEVVVPEPQQQLVLIEADDPWLQRDYTDEVTAIVTAYAPLDPRAIEGICYSGNPNITATGTQVRKGVAAADLRRLPAGTVINVPGIDYPLVVEDTGGSMRNYEGIWIDIFMETREEAFAWGKQELEITVQRPH